MTDAPKTDRFDAPRHDPRLRAALQAPGARLLAPERLWLSEGAAAGQAVVVEGGHFTAVGPLAELQRRRPDLAPLHLPGHLLMPGFVDTHRHLTQSLGKALTVPSLAISIPEAASDAMLAAVSRRCEAAGAVFQVHVNEHLASVERSLVARGLRPIEHLDAVGALAPTTLLAHATMATPDELLRLRDTGAAVAFNPVASAWKGNAVAQATMMAALGVRFGLAADFLLVDLEVPELKPSWDLGWELVRYANRDQLTAVVIAGDLRLWNGWPLDWDARALMRDVDRPPRPGHRRARPRSRAPHDRRPAVPGAAAPPASRAEQSRRSSESVAGAIW